MTAEISHATPIVFVVDGDVSVRESLELLLRCEGWKSETFGSAQEFLNRPRPFVPSCLVLDVFLPGLNGLELQKRVALERTDMPVIFITGHADVPTSVQAMKAGAVEFLMKPFKPNALVDAIRESLDRSRLALARETQLRLLRNRYALLTRRESQVMALVVSGLLNKEVGGELGISEITVKAHRGRVMQKMHAESLADLVRISAKLGAERPSTREVQLTVPYREMTGSYTLGATTRKRACGRELPQSRSECVPRRVTLVETSMTAGSRSAAAIPNSPELSLPVQALVDPSDANAAEATQHR